MTPGLRHATEASKDQRGGWLAEGKGVADHAPFRLQREHVVLDLAGRLARRGAGR